MARSTAASGSLAGRLECTPAQLALAFLLRHPHAVTIPKAASLAHVRENAGAWSVLERLGAAGLAELDAAFPAPARDVPLEMA